MTTIEEAHWKDEWESGLKRIAALEYALRCALAWIDAVPSDTPLPAMPGFDRDEVDSLLNP